VHVKEIEGGMHTKKNKTIKMNLKKGGKALKGAGETSMSSSNLRISITRNNTYSEGRKTATTMSQPVVGTQGREESGKEWEERERGRGKKREEGSTLDGLRDGRRGRNIGWKEGRERETETEKEKKGEKRGDKQGGGRKNKRSR
jgi:hypothetical protein